MALRLRKGVCIVVQRQTSTQVLVCHRLGWPRGEGWQFPQGGIKESDASILHAARRELREEIGTARIEVLAVSRRWHAYRTPLAMKRPGRPFDGQKHRWIHARLMAPESRISFKGQPAEFDDLRWVTPAAALKGVVAFKRAAYRSALRELGLLPAGRRVRAARVS